LQRGPYCSLLPPLLSHQDPQQRLRKDHIAPVGLDDAPLGLTGNPIQVAPTDAPA